MDGYCGTLTLCHKWHSNVCEPAKNEHVASETIYLFPITRRARTKIWFLCGKSRDKLQQVLASGMQFGMILARCVSKSIQHHTTWYTSYEQESSEAKIFTIHLFGARGKRVEISFPQNPFFCWCHFWYLSSIIPKNGHVGVSCQVEKKKAAGGGALAPGVKILNLQTLWV